MILNLTSLLTNPIMEEISIFLLIFISLFFALWISSKVLNLKINDFKTALIISFIIGLVYLIIHSISSNFIINQGPLINFLGMIITVILLIILIKKVYALKLSKTILTFLLTFFIASIISTLIILIMLFQFTSIPTQIAEHKNTTQPFNIFKEKFKENKDIKPTPITFLIIITGSIINIFALWWISKFRKLKRQDFKAAFLVGGLVGIISLISLLTYSLLSFPYTLKLIISILILIFSIFLIKKVYNVTRKEAIWIYITMVILVSLIYVILSFVLGLSIVTTKFIK